MKRVNRCAIYKYIKYSILTFMEISSIIMHDTCAQLYVCNYISMHVWRQAGGENATRRYTWDSYHALTYIILKGYA